MASTDDPEVYGPSAESSVVARLPPSSGCKSGHRKRQESNALPQPFYLYSKQKKHIIGAIGVIACRESLDPGNVSWVIGQGVRLQAPFPVSAQDVQYMSGIFKLATAADARLRQSTVAPGGSLHHHFLNYGVRRWRAWLCDDKQAEHIMSLCGDLPATFTTKRALLRMVGVVPDLVVPPSEPMPLSHRLLPGPIGTEGGVTGCSQDPALQVHSGTSSEVVGFARSRLQSMGAGPARGNIAHQYGPDTLLDYLQLSRSLKSPHNMRDALADAAGILLGGGSGLLQTELRDGGIAVPSPDVLRMSKLRLDMMSMMFERRLFLKLEYRRYLYTDSSPQLGFNFLCCREDRIGIPRADNLGAEFRAGYDININYESRLLPISVLGKGYAGVTKKALNCANIYLMESGSEAAFHGLRGEVRGAVADQGTEKGIVDEPLAILTGMAVTHAPKDVQSFLFPKALGIHGHLHILYNALEEAVMSLESAHIFMEQLRSLERFLSNRELRAKFQASCLAEADCKSRFNHYPTVHVEWRWEFLSKALDDLGPLFPLMQQHFDLAKILQSDAGVLHRNDVDEVNKVLQSETFLAYAEMLRVHGKAVEHSAKGLETCWCHSDIDSAPLTRKRKLQALKTRAGLEKCCWKGKRGPWWVACGLDDMLRTIMHCNSDRLQDLLSRVPGNKRADIVEEQALLRQLLHEQLSQKMAFWKVIPWRALGVFHSPCGGQLSKSKEILSQCRDQYDKAIADGLSEQQHRVSHLLFKAGTGCRDELDDFLGNGQRLIDYPTAYAALQEYALAPLVERSIEAVHAVIKRIGKGVTNTTPPFIAAALRENQNLKLLRNNADFRPMCRELWSSRTLLQTLLCTRYSAEQLRDKNYTEKVKYVYQCAAENMHEDTTLARFHREHWRTATEHKRPKLSLIHI